ncbi:hypothetical protein D9M68_436060 [compost metagenome]
MGIGRAQHDEGHRRGNQATLSDTLKNGPDEHRRQRRKEDADQGDDGSGRERHADGALVPAADGKRRHEQAGDDLHHDRGRDDRAGGCGIKAALAKDRRHPAEDAIGQCRLQPHEQGYLPGEAIAPEADNAEAAVAGLRLATQRLWRPDQEHDQSWHRPGCERAGPGAGDMVLDRQSEAGGTGRASAERHSVEARHHRGPVGEVTLDEAWEEDVADRDRRTGGKGREEQQRHGLNAAQARAERQKQQHAKKRALGAETLREFWRKRREDAEAKHRQGGEYAGACGRQAGCLHHLGQQH